MWIIFFLMIFFFSLTHADNVLKDFVREYYAASNIHQIIAFGCYRDAGTLLFYMAVRMENININTKYTDAVQFSKNLMQFDTSVAFSSIPLQYDITSILKVNYYHVGIMLDLDCPGSVTVLEEFSKKLVFNETYFWLLITSTISPSHGMLKKLPLSVDAEVTVATRKDVKFLLYDIYNPSYRHNGPYIVTYKGQWSLENGLVNELIQYKYKRRENFNLLPLNFSIVLNHPPLPDLQTYLTTPVSRHFDTMSRYHYALVLQLRDIFNFTINLHRTTSWGYLSNGTFDGILGDMVKKIVDISSSPFQYKDERFDVAEFTVETLLVKGMFLFRHPKYVNVKNNFLKPFANELWWLVLIIAAGYAISLFITVKVQLHYDKLYATHLEENDLLKIPASEATLITFAALSQQGLSDGPQMISGRIVFLSLFLWGLLLFQFYSASIVGSLLTFPPRTITTLKNLSDSNFEAGAEDIVWVYDYFNITRKPVDIELYERKIKPSSKRPRGSFWKAAEGIDKIRKGGFAFYVDTATGYKLIVDTFDEDQICELHEIPLITFKKVSIVTAKHSPFKKMIIYGLRRIVQHGLTVKVKAMWYTPRPVCPEGYSSKPTPVRIEQFIPAVFLLLIGICIALLVLGLEYMHYVKVEGSLPPNRFNALNDDIN